MYGYGGTYTRWSFDEVCRSVNTVVHTYTVWDLCREGTDTATLVLSKRLRKKPCYS